MRPNLLMSILLVAVFLMGIGGTVLARHGGWEKKDANNDGVITEQEFIDYQMKWFNKKDTNKDGNVSKEEMTAHIKEKFAKKDTNGDGKITPDEMKSSKMNPGSGK